MCGIVGTFIYGSSGVVEPLLLERMTNSIAHRGPDGVGYYYSPDHTLGFGHRRLSIIDLNTGDQPMCNEDRTIWITFNGEIYNYKELRMELLAHGHSFSTSSDTEVIIHAYEQWGLDCPARFNGIFAFGIWDDKLHRLFVARDHFGVKPLYYYDDGRCFHFASEIKAILCDPAVRRDLDLDALQFCLAFRHTPSPWTLFKHVRKAPPGSYLIVDYNGTNAASYWSPQQHIDSTKSEHEWVEELASLYPQAVKRQMISDTPIGLSLSAGVDSNTLLALMSEITSPINTFSIGFTGAEAHEDELGDARHAATRHNAEFSGRRVNEDDYIAFMERYIWHLEEPVGNESAPAYFFVAQLAKHKVKVLLSGQGADEPLAGYGRHLAARYLPSLQWIPPNVIKPIRDGLLPKLRTGESPARLLDALAQRDTPSRLLSYYSITTPGMRNSMFGPDLLQRSSPTLLQDYIATQLKHTQQGTMLEKMTFIDARTSLSDNLLMSGDKMSMAAGIEMRVPFLDLDVMRVAEAIPGRFKVRRFRNKFIHKKVCERWLSRESVHRRKVGFNPVMGQWLKKNFEHTMTELFEDRDSIARNHLNIRYIQLLQRQHQSGQFDHHRILFLLLTIEMWHKVFVNTSGYTAVDEPSSRLNFSQHHQNEL